jgi:hypothetical protein
MEPLLSISGELVLLAANWKRHRSKLKPTASQPLTQAVWEKRRRKILLLNKHLEKIYRKNENRN